MNDKSTRATIKAHGAKLQRSYRRGEVYDQLWLDSDGVYWQGDDWYSDSQATVYRLTELEAKEWMTSRRMT